MECSIMQDEWVYHLFKVTLYDVLIAYVIILLHFQHWFTEIYFISNVLTSSLLGDVADIVGNNNKNSWRFAENLIKSWKSGHSWSKRR